MSECEECRGCQNYFCTWCEDLKPCDFCNEPMCERCQDDFETCSKCKSNFCQSCSEDELRTCSKADCDFKGCEECEDDHQKEAHEDDEPESNKNE